MIPTQFERWRVDARSVFSLPEPPMNRMVSEGRMV